MRIPSRSVVIFAAVAALVAACGSDGVLDLLPPGGDGGVDGSGGDAADGGVADGGGGDASTDALTEACMNGACACGLTSCSPGCSDLANDPDHCNGCTQGCAHNQYCGQRQCRCLPTFTLCGASCFQLASNPDHCGACGNPPCTDRKSVV